MNVVPVTVRSVPQKQLIRDFFSLLMTLSLKQSDGIVR